MRLVFRGAAKEVGRSCIEVAHEGKRFLLDCGLKLTDQDTQYPVGFHDYNIDAVFISHAHLDHTGALPLMDHRGMECPIFATKMTKALTRLLLRDAFKIGRISHHHLGYDEVDIKDVLNFMTRVKVDLEGEYEGVKYRYYDAGHIPGSAMVHLELGGKSILYTGDFNTQASRLHHAAGSQLPPVDVLICESTYGDRDHPLRSKTEEKFIDSIRSTIDSGGSVIIPVFAVGRAQEVLLVLARQSLSVPIYLDGMAVTASRMILENASDLSDRTLLETMFKKVRHITRNSERDAAIRKQSIIITTSGMLTGGPVLHYLKYLNYPKNSLLLTGYQADETNGRLLLETGEIFIEGWKKKMLCRVEQYDFSAHAGLSQLKAFVRAVRPKKVFFVHGEEHSVNNLNDWASALGMESHAPALGDEYEI